jgi:hypothetical protein
MKRKEPTGGTAAEDEGSRLLRVVEQEASNFLNALPDLALRAVLDFLQRQEARAPPLSVDGMRVCGLFACMKCKRE